MGRVERHNNEVCIKGLTFSEFEVDYYEKLEKVIELQYQNEHNRVLLFKCYWYDTTDKGIKVDPYHDLVETTQNLDSAMSMMSLFSPSNASKFITHTPLPLKRIAQELISYPY
jgi:hypothetical protein